MTERQKEGLKSQMCQIIGRTMRKLAQKEMNRIGQRINQEQKKEKCGKKQLDKFPKEESSTNISEKDKRMGQEKREYHHHIQLNNNDNVTLVISGLDSGPILGPIGFDFVYYY